MTAAKGILLPTSTSTSVFNAIPTRSSLCVGGAASELALSVCTMLAAETTCYCKSATAFHLAHFRLATAVLGTQTACSDGRGAVVNRAEPVSAMLGADLTSNSSRIASCSSAESVRTMFVAYATSNNSNIAPYSRAEPQCTMFLANTPCCSLSAAAFSIARHFGAVTGVGVVFPTHTPALYCGGAAINRAWSFVMRLTEPFCEMLPLAQIY